MIKKVSGEIIKDWINYSSKEFSLIKDLIGKKTNYYQITPLNFFNQITVEEANKRIEMLKMVGVIDQEIYERLLLSCR